MLTMWLKDGIGMFGGTTIRLQIGKACAADAADLCVQLRISVTVDSRHRPVKNESGRMSDTAVKVKEDGKSAALFRGSAGRSRQSGMDGGVRGDAFRWLWSRMNWRRHCEPDRDGRLRRICVEVLLPPFSLLRFRQSLTVFCVLNASFRGDSQNRGCLCDPVAPRFRGTGGGRALRREPFRGIGRRGAFPVAAARMRFVPNQSLCARLAPASGEFPGFFLPAVPVRGRYCGPDAAPYAHLESGKSPRKNTCRP